MALSSERTCGTILGELLRHTTRERKGLQDETEYLDQELLALRLQKLYLIMLTTDELSAPLTILKDAGYVEEKRIHFGPQQRRRWLAAWRITGEGVRLLEGEIEDPRVRVF